MELATRIMRNVLIAVVVLGLVGVAALLLYQAGLLDVLLFPDRIDH